MLKIICFTFTLYFYMVLGNKGGLTTDGDILIGGLFPIHDVDDNNTACGSFNSNPGYQYMEAMLYALDKINAGQAILPGIKLGSVIEDTCNDPLKSGKKTRKFIKILFVPESTNYSELVSVVGPMLGRNAQTVANILKVFRIPQISYGALFNELSNKHSFDYFFRTVAPDDFFYAALAAFLKKMGWSYIGLAFSGKVWPTSEANRFAGTMRHMGICVGRQAAIIRVTTDGYLDRYIEKLITDDREPKIVLIVAGARDSRRMLAAKKRNPRGNELTFVAGLPWGNRKIITQDYEEVAEGIFTFGHHQGSIPEFDHYFKALRYNNYTRNNKQWIGEFWQKTHHCNLPDLDVPTNFDKNCTGDEDNLIYEDSAPVQLVINAVYAIANALDSYQRHFCPNTTGICSQMRPISTKLLLEFLKNTTFEDALSNNTVSFNTRQEVSGNYTVYHYRSVNGSFNYVSVGSWRGERVSSHEITGDLVLDESVIQWAHDNTVQPLHTCRPQCSSREIRRMRKGKHCCWDCETCAQNEVVINNTCIACVLGFTPGENSSSCLKRDLIYINMDTAFSIVLTVFSVLGIITDLVFLTAFLVYRNHPLIKASGREMCCIVFLGIATIFITSLTTLVKPTQVLCPVRRIFAGISFTICYAPLLIKVWRIHGIFKRANKLKRLSPGSVFSLGPMLGLTFIIIVINCLYSASISSTDPTKLVETFYTNRQELVLECTTNTTVFISIFAYNLMLLFGCTVYAFLTRHFPKNFNEAMYIGMTMYLTCVVWVIFFANFMTSNYSISRVYWLSGSSILIGWITLLGLFAPKFYHVYTKPEVSREMLITWTESTRQFSSRKSESVDVLRKFSNAIGRTESSASKIGNGVIKNESTLQEIGIDRLADTHM